MSPSSPLLLHLTTDPKLIGPVLPLLLRALAISAGVVAGCFFFLYLPQVAWLALFTGPLGTSLKTGKPSRRGNYAPLTALCIYNPVVSNLPGSRA